MQIIAEFHRAVDIKRDDSKAIHDWPQPFSPNRDYTGQELDNLVREHANENARHRVIRVGVILFSVLVFLVIGAVDVQDLELMQGFGLGLVSIHSWTTFHLLDIWIRAYFFRKDGGLYRIYTLSSTPKGVCTGTHVQTTNTENNTK